MSMTAAAKAAPGAPRVLYLNFSDGTESLKHSEIDEATRNESSIGRASPFPAFTWPTVADGSLSRADFVRRTARRVHELFLPYNVLITTTRPREGPYTMVMIGGTAQSLGVDARLAGVAYLDCDDVQPSNIAFAFPALLRGNDQGIVMTIAQEAAHAFGLEHTSDPEDVMYPSVDERQSRFTEGTSRIFGEHHCGNETQSSHRKLLETVGPWLGDDKPLDDGSRSDRQPPEVALLDPQEGEVVGQPFVVRARASDDQALDRVVLAAGDERLALRRPPFEWSLAAFPQGRLVLNVTAYDVSGNVATSARAIEVRPGAVASSFGCRVGGAAGRAGAERRRHGSQVAPILPVAFAALALVALRHPRGRRRSPCAGRGHRL